MQTPAFKVVIPARFASTRLPGKVLAEIAGKPMIQHVYERACASGAEQVIIATDDERVLEAAKNFNAACYLTSSEHISGSDRIAEVAAKLEWADEAIVVNVQGDEPLISPANIAQVACNLAGHNVEMATLRAAIESDVDVCNPNIVKVVVDAAERALYFSRAAIPFQRDDSLTVCADYYRHIGLYAYTIGFLRRFTQAPAARLEEVEKLEQLRALWLGAAIHVAIARETSGPGIDTAEDLERVRGLL